MQKLNLIDKTAAFLSGNKKSASEILEQKSEVNARLAEIENRQAFLTKRGIADARELSDHTTVEALLAEAESLKSEEATLLARRQRLHREHKAAAAAELVRDAKRVKADIAGQVSEVERIQSQLAEAQGKLERSINVIVEASGHEQSPELKLDRNTAQRVAAVKFGVSRMRENVGDRARFTNQLAGKPEPQKQDAGIQEEAGIFGGNAA